jgi:hypothetical protein
MTAAAIAQLPDTPEWTRDLFQMGDDTCLRASRQEVRLYQSSGSFTETAYVRRNLETAEEVQDLDCQGSVKLIVQMLLHPLEVTVKTVCYLSVHNRVRIGEAIPPIRHQCLEPGTGVV